MTEATDGRLVEWVARAARVRRVLQIGIGDVQDLLSLAGVLPSDGLFIAVERDPGIAQAARTALSGAGPAANALVIAADATRYVYKIAGPFDLIVQSAVPSDARLFEQVLQRLAPGGVLVTLNIAASADYNEKLAEDSRLHTIVLRAGTGVALSVTRQDRHDD